MSKKEKVEKKIVPGATVYLAGDKGGRRLTVESINILADVANVVWFDESGRLFKAGVTVKALRLV